MKFWVAGFIFASMFTGQAMAGDLPEPTVVSEPTESGTLRVQPDSGVSGEFGTWTVTYTVGPEGIRQGGGIRVELPDAWHAGPRNSANRLQASNPADDHYVSGKSSRADVRIHVVVEHESKDKLVKEPRPSLDGRFERFVYVVRAVVQDGALKEGDSLSIVYGDTTGGSRGYLASAVSSRPQPILVAVDARGDNRFRMHAKPPQITAVPGKPVEMQFHAPSTARIGETMRLLVSLVDKESNPTVAASLVDIVVAAGSAEIPTRVEIPAGKGYAEFTAKPKADGVLRMGATASGLGLAAKANPVDVRKDAISRRIYWGDLHSHTRYSWDGVGDDAYVYARYTSGLDFYAMTDHSMDLVDGRGHGLNRDTWKAYLDQVEAHNAPPQFVTIPAYECSFGAPFGHHNVFFRNDPGPLVYPSEKTLPELWKALKRGDALTIPHHTGKFPRGIDLSIHNPDFRRNIEIYSAHGLSEAYNPDHPLSFEHSDFTSDSKSVTSPTYAQDAWKMGQELSTIASSDDHRAHPGQPNYGLAAIMAPELTRDAIFQSLYDRFTYGTTGAKIVLDVTLNNVSMGQIAQANGPVKVSVRALGTDTIEAVELLRLRSGGSAFEVIKTWSPNALDFNGDFTDEAAISRTVYYVRVKQKGTVRGRAVMAWSSPIWVVPKG